MRSSCCVLPPLELPPLTQSAQGEDVFLACAHRDSGNTMRIFKHAVSSASKDSPSYLGKVSR